MDIIGFVISAFGCPSYIFLFSFVCPLLPIIIIPYIWDVFRAKKGRDNETISTIEALVKSLFGSPLGYVLVFLYVIYACYAFMIPQAWMSECGTFGY